MKKKIVADLTSLAHSILQLKDKENVHELQAIAKELYEKLTVLVFTEKHFSDVKPTAGAREVESKLEQAFTDAQKDIKNVSQDVEQVMEEAQQEVREAFASNDLSDLFVPEEDTREEMDLPGISTISKMVIEMPDDELFIPDPSRLGEEENEYRKTGKLPNRYRDSFSTNSLNDLEVPEEDDREEIELPGMSTIQKMVVDMPDKAPDAPQPAANKYYDVKKIKDKELDKERKSFTTNSLTHLVVPEEDDREEIDLPGMSTIQKMVVEMPDDDEKQPKKTQPSTHSTTDLEQLTADFQKMPVFERKSTVGESSKPQSLNAKLNTGFKIGVNDRMGFVKNLFNGNNQDFNRVISQLNTINSFNEAQQFIQTMIKPDYNNWEGKESFETRFMDLVERQYL